jgi:hypothetical protein
MKKTIFLLSIVFLGILMTTYYSCETNPEETCYQDEICTDKFVTACCTEDKCVYKYNGKEYTEDEIDQLEKDMGCGGAAVSLKSAGEDNDRSAVIERLKALMERVKKETGFCK